MRVLEVFLRSTAIAGTRCGLFAQFVVIQAAEVGSTASLTDGTLGSPFGPRCLL
jgi:hypothetical protein